jgi:capsular exopolysaccharide synthesis family protein
MGIGDLPVGTGSKCCFNNLVINQLSKSVLKPGMMEEHFQPGEQQESVDYKAIFFKLFNYWYVFILTMIMAFLIAYFFNKYSRPMFDVKTTILVKDQNDKKIDPQDMIGFGFGNMNQNVQNEIGILSSYNMVYSTILNTGFEVSYFSKGRFATSELYTRSPYIVALDTSVAQPLNLRFNITILSREQYKLEVKAENVQFYSYSERKVLNKDPVQLNFTKTLYFGKDVITPYFKFKIVLNAAFDPTKDIHRSMYFQLRDYDGLANEFRGFSIERVNKEASILMIKITGGNVDKLADFLNALTKEYIEKGLEKKNLAAARTIAFIDKELKGITDSLTFSEKELQEFKAKNEIMSMDDESKQVFDKMVQLQEEKAKVMVQSKYLVNLKEYVEKNTKLDELIIPSSMGVDDDLLNQLTLDLTRLYTEKKETTQYSKATNPSMKSLDIEINSTKIAIFETIKNAIKTNNIALKDLDDRIGVIFAKINQLPGTERVLFGIERRFKLTDAIYTYLLQKRSEAQITQASNLPDNEVIDRARAEDGTPVYPKTSMNYMIALILGLILPVVIILGKDFLNDTIKERADVEKITSLPIIGHIIHSDKESKVVVMESPKSSIAESFRSVRTNLQYLLLGKEKQTILITSDMVQAGKTFCSINLATIFAMYGKKTLLMGFDLRKPKIHKDFDLSNDEGISSYLINKSKLESCIQPSGIENLDVLVSGPIPPNPSELAASDKTGTMFALLKDIYDFIIIDTPPIGLVTDAFLLMKYTDANLILVRQNFTHKKVFSSIIRDMEQRKMPNLAILINDVKQTKYSYGFGYGYGYGFGHGYGYNSGYGYGYYAEDRQAKKKSVLRRIFGRS